MALENITNMTSSEFLNSLPPQLLAPFEKLITILQVAGIVLLIYILILLIKGILGWRRNMRIDKTYEAVLEINEKLDELLNRAAKKEKKSEKQEKTPGFFAGLFGKKGSKKRKLK